MYIEQGIFLLLGVLYKLQTVLLENQDIFFFLQELLSYYWKSKSIDLLYHNQNKSKKSLGGRKCSSPLPQHCLDRVK